jgi:transposase
VFQTLVTDPDMEWVFIDGSYAKAHQHSAGAAGGMDQAIGKSRAGNTSKIHLAVDACGLPVVFEITGGQINDCTQAPALIAKVPATQMIIADKGYDSEAIREQVEQQGAKAVIARKRNSVKGNADLDRGLYRNRHLVENAFARLETILRIHLLQNWFSLSNLRGIVGRQALPQTPHRAIHVEIARSYACIVQGAVGAAQGGLIAGARTLARAPGCAISAK